MSPTRVCRSLALVALFLLACSHPSAVAESPPADPVEQSATPPAPECQADTDCRVTPLPSEGCCRTSCTPRAVSSAVFDAEEKAREGCDASRCVELTCRPESAQVQASCDAGHCVLKRPARSPRD